MNAKSLLVLLVAPLFATAVLATPVPKPPQPPLLRPSKQWDHDNRTGRLRLNKDN
ncbi:hypothetical protein BJ508DRAFT_413271 [Ascobolus immersus RN42]|uniref:Uncharacterized protein n=1 Tax=Ascobolus immersus RN42 TaxID=1160509 RepID=A0A3N4IDQ1_ASCIM|nr:hypothetical protein BJ508DRAFT_413271 [Ascobolus immersus RN42]